MNASAGVLPSQALSALIQKSVINASTPFLAEQIQPALIYDWDIKHGEFRPLFCQA